MISTNPYVCKICGRQSFETELICDNEDFCVCKEGFGCKEEKFHCSVFRQIYKDLDLNGNECSPRGLVTKEIENFKCIFPPFVRFANFNKRNLKINYIKREFLWYLKGNKFDISILKYAKMWKDFVNIDGSINSNYGQYIFGEVNQFKNVVDTLIKDPNSRRASMIILQPYHLLNKDMKEVPCTYSLNFRIRNNCLNMTVHMRSQDAFLGFGSDIPIFSFIHEMIFNMLKNFFKINYGEYYHSVESFHVYEKHFNLIHEFATKDNYFLINCPKISSEDEVRFLLKNDFLNIPLDFKFTQWINNFD